MDEIIHVRPEGTIDSGEGSSDEFKPLKTHFKRYKMLDGSTKECLQRVSDGSIIKRFEHTPYPKKDDDVICPHFMELKWGYGCPYNCAWCFLKGTLRMLPEKTSPKVKPREKVEQHVLSALSSAKNPEVFNSGELCDSLMDEKGPSPFSKWITDIFQSQDKHKVLFLTKSGNVDRMLEIDDHSQAIASFSLNAEEVARQWEKAPAIEARIDAAKKLFDAGWEVRIRIDPVVPINGWKHAYKHLIESIFSSFTPSRVTLGTPRGLQSTLNNVSDKSWIKYLDGGNTAWGKKIRDELREEIYRFVISNLEHHIKADRVGICKETRLMFQKLEIDYAKQVCNCIK